MHIEKQKILQELFPILFSKSNTVNPWNPHKCFEPIEGFGIECGDGWFDIIAECAGKIEEYNNSLKPKNILHILWIKFADRFLSKIFWKYQIPFFPSAPVRAVQIKEKYGLLNIYLDNYIEVADDATDKAYQKSETICEVCGKPGKMREDRGWYFTACNYHFKNRNKYV